MILADHIVMVLLTDGTYICQFRHKQFNRMSDIFGFLNRTFQGYLFVLVKENKDSGYKEGRMYSEEKSSIGKTMEAVHFTTISCEPNTTITHREPFFAIFVPV